MKNNQSSLKEYLLSDLDDQYQAEDYHNIRDINLLNDVNDNDDYFNQSYTEFNGQNQNLDNPILNISVPNINTNFDENIGDSFLSTTINYADYDNEDEDDEIHYLNFIKKSEKAVFQQNTLVTQSHSYSNFQQEEKIKTYTIVCIDDSRAVVNAIKMYLDDNIFAVVGINDPLKALMQVVRLKPDLILLDITMPTLDGYELCSLLRKHSSLKETPIIMVTGKKGIINRVKAKMVKASDYITKPFHKKDLLKVIFKYIV